MATMICIISGLFWALFDLSRKLSLNHVSPKSILIYFNIIQSVIFFIWVIYENFSINFLPYLFPGITLIILGVFSAKGGVGKSVMSVNLAKSLVSKGFKVGLVDGHIYGPRHPELLNATDMQLNVTDQELLDPLEKNGLKFNSMGFISSEKMPVIWRGPMVSGAIMQLIAQTNWGKLDYLIIDTPPGTGDVQLTLLQKIALTGAIVVTTPQDISLADTKKGIEMLKKLDLPILGLIENMSFFKPNDSDKKYYLYGKEGGKKLAKEYKLDLLGEVPQFEFNNSNLTNENEIITKISNKIVENSATVKLFFLIS